jgi:hypothetical protein
LSEEFTQTERLRDEATGRFYKAVTAWLATLLLSRLIDWFSLAQQSSSRGRLDYRA